MSREKGLPSEAQLANDFAQYALEHQERVDTYNAVLEEGAYETVADNMYHGITTACFLAKPNENFQDAAIKLTEHFYVQTDEMWKKAEGLSGEEAEQYKAAIGDLSLEGLADFAHRNFTDFTRRSVAVDESPEKKRRCALIADYWSGVDQVADIAQSNEDESVA